MKNTTHRTITLFFLLTISITTLTAQALPSFDKIILTGNVSALLVEGTEERIDIKNDSEHLEYEVEGQTLKVTAKNLIKYNEVPTIKIILTYEGLREIKARAGASAYSEEVIETEVLKLRFSSGATGELRMTTKTVEVGVSEGGSLELHGETKFLEAKSVTGGTLSAYQLDSQQTVIRVNTGGSAKVVALESINAIANTGGSISYKGNPNKVKTKDGLSGTVKEF